MATEILKEIAKFAARGGRAARLPGKRPIDSRHNARRIRDILVDRQANALISDFVARKMRQRVKDPAVAEKLIPKNHGFGTRRVPLESGYFEIYNQPNVKLIDMTETPIERITSSGIKTGDAEYEFDIIIYATGFGATGSWSTIAGIRLLGEILRKEGRNCSPMLMFTGLMLYGTPASSRKIVILCPFGVVQ
jgi:cation diffusion facilitator CzcD-associated flavoprotein CzcO